MQIRVIEMFVLFHLSIKLLLSTRLNSENSNVKLLIFHITFVRKA